MTMRNRLSAFAWLLAALMAAPAAAGLDISDPWVREAPPAAPVMAGYMSIRNGGTAAVHVIAVSSPEFARAELHRTVVEDGIARMERVGQLEIAAGERVALEPGGLHLMLFEPTQALQQGDSVTLFIHRADGMCMTLQAPVRRDTVTDNAHPHHHTH
jgi:copper(I)-binding protein